MKSQNVSPLEEKAKIYHKVYPVPLKQGLNISKPAAVNDCLFMICTHESYLTLKEPFP